MQNQTSYRLTTVPLRFRLTAALVVLGAVATGCRDTTAPLQREPNFFGSPDASLSNLWKFIPSLSTPRQYFGGVVLGNCVWIVGGDDNSGPTDAVESLCNSSPAPSSWTSQAPLPEKLTSFAGVATIGSSIYVAGGVDANGFSRSTLYIYDQAMGWRLDAEPMPRAMGCGAGTVYAGKLYVHAPGISVDSADLRGFFCQDGKKDAFAVYDPSLPAPPRWRLLPPASNPFSAGRLWPGLATIGNNLYLVGGNFSDLT